jgi:hypothetical protein
MIFFSITAFASFASNIVNIEIAPSITDIAFSEFATVDKSIAPTLEKVAAVAVVPPPVKLSEALLPALAVTE